MKKSPYTKEALLNRAITTVHRRTVVFYKLVQHKIQNGYLPWSSTTYLTALSLHYKKVCQELELQKFTRMGRARNESGKFIKMNNEPIKWNEKIFSRKKYDAELRAIIENVAKNVKDAP